MKRLFAAAVVVSLVMGPVAAAYAADRTVGEKVDDAAITAKVKTELATERAKDLVSVNVDTNDGVVHLQGTVPTAADKAKAERLARATSGVRAVSNDLTVTESSPSASPGTTK